MLIRGSTSILCLLAGLAASLSACDRVGSCPARDDSVSLSFSLTPGADADVGPFEGECTVASVGAGEVVFDCAGTQQTLGFSTNPAPDLGAFTPGLAVRIEHYQQSPPSVDRLRITAGADVILVARTGSGSLAADDWAPLQFSDESFCSPRQHDDCGYTFARYAFSAAVGDGAPVELHDGSYAEVGGFQVWVPQAIEVMEESNKCADAYPGRYTMALLRAP